MPQSSKTRRRTRRDPRQLCILDAIRQAQIEVENCNRRHSSATPPHSEAPSGAPPGAAIDAATGQDGDD